MREFTGIGASSGLVIGKALVWQRPSVKVKRRHCRAQEVPRELSRLDAALEMTRSELAALKEQLEHQLGADHGSILDAQLLILEDEELIEATREGITREHLAADAAFARAMGEAILPLNLSGESFFRERVIDFQDVERAFNHNYFLLHTESLIPNTYYMDVKVSSNNEVSTIKEILSFDIVSQSELRISQ